jgi:hypothetical protein
MKVTNNKKSGHTKQPTISAMVVIVIVVLVISSITTAAPFPALVSSASAKGYQGSILLDEMEQERPARLSSTAPSVLSQGQDVVTAQGALASLQVRPSSNIVDTNVYYNIQFRASTTGEIDRIRMVFPEGTYLGNAKVLEVEGIGKGRPVGEFGSNILLYDLDSAQVVPAGTQIRLEFANIGNPPTPSTSNTVTVTTVDSSSLPVDGPTVSATYTLRQVQTDQIANSAITANKISPTFMISKILQDGQNGWNPDSVLDPASFTITDNSVKASNSHVYVSVDEPSDIGPLAINVVCMVEDIENSNFEVACDLPPTDGSVLRYTVINQP